MGGPWTGVHASMSADEDENQKCKLWLWQIQRDPQLGDCTFDVGTPVRGTNLSVNSGIYLQWIETWLEKLRSRS